MHYTAIKLLHGWTPVLYCIYQLLSGFVHSVCKRFASSAALELVLNLIRVVILTPTCASGSFHAAGKGEKVLPSKYDLIGNVVHDGKPGAGGTYRLHVHRKSEDAWYEVQDLRVTDILPQMVALSETYMQVYELKAQA